MLSGVAISGFWLIPGGSFVGFVVVPGPKTKVGGHTRLTPTTPPGTAGGGGPKTFKGTGHVHKAHIPDVGETKTTTRTTSPRTLGPTHFGGPSFFATPASPAPDAVVGAVRMGASGGRLHSCDGAGQFDILTSLGPYARGGLWWVK